MFEEDFPADLQRPIGVFPGKPGGGQSDRSTGESDASSNLSVSAVPSWGSGPGRPLLGRPYIPPLELPLHMQGRPFGTSHASAGSSKDQEPPTGGGPAPTGWPRTEFPTFAPQTLTAAHTQTQSKTAVVFGPAQEQGGAPPPPFPWGTSAMGSGGYASRHFPGGDGNDDGDGGDGGRKPEDNKKKKKKKSKKGNGGGAGGDGGSDSSSSSSEQSEVSRNRDRSRRREGESIKFPALPSVAGFQAWQQAVEDAIIACSVLKEETVYDWLQRGQGVLNEAGFDTLGKFSSKFDSLDSKISAGLAIVMKGELGRLIHERNEREKTKNRRRLKGVQRLKLISDYYRLDDDKDMEFTMTDLAAVKFRDDKSLEAFWNSWNKVLTRVNTSCVQESFIERMFFDQLKKSNVLREDIAHYNRQETGHEHKNRDYLNRSVTRYLDRVRKDANRNEVTAALNGEHASRGHPAGGAQEICAFHARGSCRHGDSCKHKHVGPAGSGKGSPKGGGKGSGKSGGGSASAGGGTGKGKTKGKGKTGGSSSRSQSPAQSPRTMNLPCYDWNEGKCNRSSCRFVHRKLTEDEKRNRTVRAKSPAAAGAKVCNYFMKGNCNKGAACKDQHPGGGSVPGTPRPKNKKSGGAAGSPAPLV